MVQSREVSIGQEACKLSTALRKLARFRDWATSVMDSNDPMI